MLQPRKLGAGQQAARPGGVIKHCRNLARRPQAKDRDRHRVHVGEKHTHTRAGIAQQSSPLACEQIHARQQSPIGEFLHGEVLQDDLPGPLPGGLRDRLRQGGRAKFHLGLEPLSDHLVAQPVGEPRAGGGCAGVLQIRRGEHVAEVDGQARKTTLLAGRPGEGQALRTTDECGDDLGPGLENQEARAVEQLHQRAGGRNAAFREQHEPAAVLEIFRHALDGERRIHVHGKSAAVDHHAFVEPTDVRCGAGRNEPPVILKTDADEQPVPPRNVVRQKQDWPGCVEDRDVIRPEPIEEAN